jgi:HPt (histidine-containing phosphotransfer) domain-containing protein
MQFASQTSGVQPPSAKEGGVVSAPEALVFDMLSLSKRCLGNVTLVERVLTKFRETGNSDLRQLQEALDRSDFDEVAEVSHRFKGAASNISASRLQDLAARAEQLGRERNRPELAETLVKLRSEWLDFTRCSDAFISTPNT